MASEVSRGIRRRSDWIRRNPGTAGDYIRLSKNDRAKVDKLFMTDRRLKANEVTSYVERLTEERLKRRRTANVRAKALANIRANLSDREKYADSTVVENVAQMTPKLAAYASTASVDDLIALARIQQADNLFFYH